MNLLFALFLLAILMLDAQNSAIMQVFVHLILSHHQQDNNKLPTYNSCIDIIFFNNLNIISNIVLSFQYLKNVIIISFLGKFTFLFHSPSRNYVCKVWYYSKANIRSIQRAIQTFDLVKTFGNLSVEGK